MRDKQREMRAAMRAFGVDHMTSDELRERAEQIRSNNIIGCMFLLDCARELDAFEPARFGWDRLSVL